MAYQYTIRLARRQLLNINRSIIMGIINATPDSFYSHSRKTSEEEIRSTVRQMIANGAQIIDIGGYSTRPDAAFVSEQEETDRLCSAITFVRAESDDIVISADTFRSKVALAAIEAGADIINDVSGGAIDADIMDIAAIKSVPYVLTHSIGKSVAAQQTVPNYADFIGEVVNYFAEKIDTLHKKGVADIIIDPGFGFSKTMEQNYTLLRHLSDLAVFGCPVLIGVSRKRMAYIPTNRTPEDSLFATTALHALALQSLSPIIIRAHDVAAAQDAINIAEAYKKM